MAVPAARYLVHFDEGERGRDSERRAQESVIVSDPQVVEDNSAERLQEAYLRGRDEGLAVARDGFDKDVAEVRHRFEEEMEVARARWAEEITNRLADQIPAAFRDVEERIALSVARILRPTLLAAVREDVLASLTSTLRKLRSGDGGHVICISGSGQMLEELRGRLPELERAIEFLPSQDIEVKATADQTILESQMCAWASLLDTVLE